MNSIYLLRMRLIFRDKLTGILLFSSLILFLLIINSLSLGAQDKSNIPIGVLNLDHSKSANELVNNVKQVPALNVFEGDENSLNKLLYEERISALFVIQEGYEEFIQSGKTNDLITMYYLDNNKTSKIISDIFAGEMLYKICLYKGFKLYDSLSFSEKNKSNVKSDNHIPTNKFSGKDYFDYVNELTKSTDFNFSFDISMINVEKNKIIGTQLSNSIIYQQIIWGIIGMLLSFVTMLMAVGIVQDKQLGLNKRFEITFLRTSVIDASNTAAILTILNGFSLPLCLIIGSKVKYFTWLKGIELYLLIMLFCYVMTLCFIILSKVINTVGKYQCISVIVILTLGLLGFCYIMKGFLDDKLLNIFKFIPNSWFIQGFTDIILNGSLQDIPYEAYVKMILTAVFLSILNKLIVLRQNKWYGLKWRLF